jgi:hypothetical protein
MPAGYNDWPASRTPDMVTFALAALSAQLQQAYWALALAMALNRTLVLPQVRGQGANIPHPAPGPAAPTPGPRPPAYT